MYLGENHHWVPFKLGACCNRDLTSHQFLANENLIAAFCEIGKNWHAKYICVNSLHYFQWSIFNIQ